LENVLSSQKEHGLFVVASTNDRDDLSSLLQVLFPRHVSIGVLSGDERSRILETLFCDLSLSSDVTMDDLVAKTSGFTVEDLQTLVSLARDDAVVDESHGDSEEKLISMRHFTSALSRMQRHQGLTIGRPKIPDVRWEDIGGLEDVKEKIMDTCWLPLAHKDMFPPGAQTNAGILLYGPPGTGKTLIAKAVATELSMNFLSVKGPELISMYIGESEKNVRTVFETARNASPCVIFFDELDSLAPKRGSGADSGGVMDRVVSQMLAELDGRSDGHTIFVIGATNRPDLLEPALMSPGRFDNLLYLGLSNTVDAKLKILRSLTRCLPLAPDVNLSEIAEHCPPGLSGADMSAVCSGAYLNAMEQAIERRADESDKERNSKLIVTKEDFLSSLSRVQPSVTPQEMQRYEALHQHFSH